MSDEFNCGWIEIKRRPQYFACLRTYEIIVDDKKEANVKNAETKILELPPGQHTVLAKLDWCKSKVVTVNIKAGETTTLYTGSEIAGWKIMIATIYMFMPGRTIFLTESADAIPG